MVMDAPLVASSGVAEDGIRRGRALPPGGAAQARLLRRLSPQTVAAMHALLDREEPAEKPRLRRAAGR